MSRLINESFDATYVNLSTSVRLNDIGKSSWKKFFLFINLLLHVTALLTKRRFDLCYITLNSKGTGFYKDLVIVSVVKIFRVNIIYHLHNSGVKNYQDKVCDNLLYHFAFRNTHCILLSTLLYNDVSKYLNPDQVFYCANGIPNIARNPVPKSEIHSAPSILFLSNMMKEKGVFDLLEALSMISKRGIPFECRFVGAWDSVKEDEFAMKVADLGLIGKISAHGGKYGQEKEYYYHHADLFVFPSHNECFPLVLLEAMQHGLPVISTCTGGIPGIVAENETGLLCPPRNVDALADKVEMLLVDKAMRIRFGNAGLARYKANFTSEHFENQFREILFGILPKKSKSPE